MPTMMTPGQARGALRLLGWYRAFIRSDKKLARNPEVHNVAAGVINKEDAQRRLTYLVDVAVNRRGGLWPVGHVLKPKPGHPLFFTSGYAPLNHRDRECRNYSTEAQICLTRDAARLRGYGGCGRKLEHPLVRRRLGSDHVHVYGVGKVQLCGGCDG